jgi:hypothetical protein
LQKSAVGLRDELCPSRSETIFNVFRKKNGAIRHFHRVPDGENWDDLVDPLWGLFDMTPEGRGEFFPKVSYD